MKKPDKRQLHIFFSVASLMFSIVLALSAVSICFGWFSFSEQAQSEGIGTSLHDGQDMKFASAVIAVRHYLTNATLTNTYRKAEDGSLSLESSVYDPGDSEGEETTQTPGADFLFTEMLPGEYVDVTVGIYLKNKSLVGKNYELSLGKFGTAEENRFTLVDFDGNPLEGGPYGVLGVFRWGIVEENADPEMHWFRDGITSIEGQNGEKGDADYSVAILSGVWAEANIGEANAKSVTFRIEEDFTHYYAFLNEKNKQGAGYSNYLSEKKLSIGSVMLREGGA